MPDGIIAVIDPGESRSRVLVARHRAGSVRVLALADSPAEGREGGLVTDANAATRSIRSAVHAVERQLGYPIYSAVLCVPGPAVYSINGQAAVEPSGLRRTVSHRDTDRVLSRARPKLNETRQRLLHLLPMRYTVDGVVYEDYPLRVRGRELTVSTCALVSDAEHIQRMTDAVQAAGVEIVDYVATPLAGSLAVLTEAEQRIGVLLLDIGYRTSTLAVLQRGCFVYSATLPVGGYHLTNDIAMGLSIPFEAAEKLKTDSGSLYLAGGAPVLEVMGDRGPINIQRQEMIALLRDRAQELLALVARRLQSAGWENMPTAGVVLSGGSSHLSGMERLTRDLLHVPARVGSIRGLEMLPAAAQDPTWASAAGAVLWKALCISGENGSLAVPAPRGSADPLHQRLTAWASKLFEIDPNQTNVTDTQPAGKSSKAVVGAAKVAVARKGEED